MEFEWDENKRAQVLADRMLDLADAGLFFDGRPAIHQASPRAAEERLKTTAFIEGALFTLVWCWRGEVVRVITMRRAHEKEIRAYRQVHGR
ncbi:MAG: BrnT family toxin [Proteobacteria bacterium]|nr:BrnT family toxin [Pseudomonadota bacterium]